MVAAWSFESCFGLVRVSVGNGASDDRRLRVLNPVLDFGTRLFPGARCVFPGEGGRQTVPPILGRR
ncbi:MAG: hypothetical protein BWX66_01140 [Deltaproteobacteria bacterium ADurb.Bin058]|jgi:hypothetical protein|nr:MAG: hypothetical protein BWX66_01140 [Deltaproteobacteria bacterium ADurb.Bin058]